MFLPDGSAIDLTSPRQVEDGAFALVDISVNLADDATASEVAKIIDEGFEPELGVCNSASIGAMAMEDSVRYSFRLGQGQEAVTATLFTGARSTHWANDFFCQYNEEIGPSGATMRVTGFFYVIDQPAPEAAFGQAAPAEDGAAILALIEKLGALKQAGLLTEEEFATKKAELLARL